MSENKTGLPDAIKSGIESLSGVDISDVRVHYNSAKPAQLNAHAYAQGVNVHLSPDVSNPHDAQSATQLAHELWHVVQQKQGRLKPGPCGGLVTNDAALESEADAMANKVVANLGT